MESVKLSIIMPVYNVEKTIRFALESIFMQKVNFLYEIIVVDDASSDSTLKIIEEYVKKIDKIKIIVHDKNEGNAISFYDGLSVSQGDYFCVLDGDDYYTVKDKLQKQVDFLDSDKENNYTAVVHKYLRVNSQGMIFNDLQLFSNVSEYDYLDFLEKGFYYHTSTYMYRNIFKNCVPISFKDELSRGDNPRTFMHLIYTKGKVKVLKFVGSVYFYTNRGIWSQTSINEQNTRNINMFEYLFSKLSTSLERKKYTCFINKYKNSLHSEIDTWLSKDEHLKILKTLVQEYTFNEQEFIFKSLYKSKFVDSYCESIGFVELVERNYFPLKSTVVNEKNVLITISKLTTTGSGVYYEIKDIIKIYSKYNVYLLLSDVDDETEVDDDVIKQLNDFNNVQIVYGSSFIDGKLDKLFDLLLKINPIKIYYYCGHDNVYVNALIQSIWNKNVCVFSFDHGFSLGLDNTNYDVYIAKRSMDYEILKKKYNDKVIYIPCWSVDKIGENKYIPFNSHKNLITACAAARYYKLIDKNNNYVNFIVKLLKKTKGKHIHYGPIPDEEFIKIKNTLKKYGVDQDNFINVVFSDNLSKSMYNENVDIFIEPFPIVSYKITLDVLSAGIPIIVHKSCLRMEITDFIYKQHLEWMSENDFLETLINVSGKELLKHSELSRKYFVQNHSLNTISEYFVNELNFVIPETIRFWDANLIDISNIENMIINKNQKTRKNTFFENLISIRKQKEYKILTFLWIKFRIKM